MTDEIRLAEGFPPGDEAIWRQLVAKALDGKSADTLTTRTEHGVPVRALSREADWPARLDPAGAPGSLPFVRGAAASRDPYLPWDIRQVVAQPDPDLAMQETIEALEGGASSVELRIDVEGRLGIAIGDTAGLARLIQDVRLDLAPVSLESVGGSAGTGLGAAIALASAAQARGAADARLAFNLDPIGCLAQTGAMPTSLGGPLEDIAVLARDLGSAFPNARTIRLDARPVHEAGGTDVQDIAYLAGSAAEYLRALVTAGLSPNAACRQLLGALSIGADYHVELSRLRAARRVLARIAEAFGATGPDAAIPIQAVTARRMVSRVDPWSNLLRNTAACFAAGVGGADIITVRPFTDAIGQPGALARRLARNTQIIAQEEARLGVVLDPPGGAWSFEKLGADLAEAAWSLFQSIEAEGGLVRALRNGRLQSGIADARAARQKAVARRKEWITGVTDFPMLTEMPVDATPYPDTGSVHGKASRGPAPTSLRFPELLAAAEAGAGLLTLEPQGADEIEAEVLWPVRLAEPWERLRERALAKSGSGAPLKVFLAALGPLSEHSPRLTFAQNFFAAGGIEAVSEAVDAASAESAYRASGCRLACLCGSDRRYASEAPDVAAALKRSGAQRLYLAGRGGDAESLFRAAGVEEFIFVGCDALASLELAHAELGL